MTSKQSIVVELSAVIVGVRNGQPTVRVAPGPCLPSGPLETGHGTLQQALRAWARTRGRVDLGYIEQLYTFADKNRTSKGRRIISIGYLALEGPQTHNEDAADWYAFFPWEDHRKGPPTTLFKTLRKSLADWRKKAPDAQTARTREARIAVTFPPDPRAWDEELVLQRYELLWEAGLIEEAGATDPLPGRAMQHDHRRILATAMARLRTKIKYRPVVFELMPERFTLLELQETVEALAGLRLHKQNFRRLVLSQGLIEETTALSRPQKGRPAKLFAFRRDVLAARAVAGTKLPKSG